MGFDEIDVGDIIITKYSYESYGENNFAIHRVKSITKMMECNRLNCIVLFDASETFQPGYLEIFSPMDNFVKSVKVLFKKRGDEYAV